MDFLPDRYPVIPLPKHAVAQPGQLLVDRNTTLTLPNDPLARAIVLRSAERLSQKLGFVLEETQADQPRRGAEWNVALDPTISDREGYRLLVTPTRLELSASGAEGLFYGFQTVEQLLLVSGSSGRASVDGALGGAKAPWSLPAVLIEDEPRFRYRGLHLDVGRHFFPLDFLKKLIDEMAALKLNFFHWHLTEDQGWRLEIKRYPKLTEVGAFRRETVVGHSRDVPRKYDGKPYGGFYTQDQARELVEYAAERCITIVPEIEMPGHALAALAAYPELGSSAGPFEVATSFGIFDDIFCPTEQTFAFLEGVLEEVLDIFPSPYIHVGGDEARKIQWKASNAAQAVRRREGLKDEEELQSYFIRRIEAYLTRKGRRLVGWDEILEGGLAETATVMSWRGVDGGIAAARLGRDVIMTPTSHCYFDYYQEPAEKGGLAIGGFLPLDKVYAFEPVPDALSSAEAKHVLGAQANVWTEYMRTEDRVEYMVFPRLLALAEVVWSPKEARDYASFSARLPSHLERLQTRGIRYARRGSEHPRAGS